MTTGTFLTADWRWLVMLNYEVAPAILLPHVPVGTTLDLFQNRAFVSVVGFRFTRTRVLGVPIPLHEDFDEVNLRFYVRRDVEGAPARHGVVFIRELVPRLAVAVVARLTFNEPYRAVPMRHTAPDAPTEMPGRVAYEWRTSAGWQHVAATAVGHAATPVVGSLTSFLSERHWGYTRQRDGGTVEYEVTHPRWRVWEAESPELTADVRDLYGAEFEPALAAPPATTYVVEGSSVTVHSPTRIAGR